MKPYRYCSARAGITRASLCALAFLFGVAPSTAHAKNLITGVAGRISVELVGSDAVYSNSLLLVRTVGSTARPILSAT